MRFSTKQILQAVLTLCLCVTLLLTIAIQAEAVTADSSSVEINETTFPDANFRSFILSQTYGQDGVLTPAELSEITSMHVSCENIADLAGIEHFTALKELVCECNPLTSLDVSKNTALATLICTYNELTSLDVSKNTALTFLNCDANSLTTLDISKNVELSNFSCGNNLLTSLDVSKNTALLELWCCNNQLTSLDISKNTALSKLWCSDNQLTSLDVSKNTALTFLNCDANSLTTLDISKNVELSNFSCGNNLLTSLDVSKNTALLELWCCNNQLTSLDISKNTALSTLWCSDNQLTSLDVSKNAALLAFVCEGNSRTITAEENKFDLSTLAASGFDVKKAKNWKGGTVNGNILTVTSNPVTYTYNLGNGETATFSLQIAGTPVVKASNVASSGKVKLTWEKIEGATEYKIYRATSKDGEYKLIKTTAGTSFTNTSAKAGSTYYYKVKAIHSNSSANSICSEIVSRACDLPQPVVKASNVASSGKVKLTWSEVEGAKEYEVYRATSKDGEYKLMKTTTGTSYTNTSAKAGSTYYYKVKAIHSKSSANSAYSEIVSRTCDLARPVVSIKLKDGNPRLTWEKVDGAKEYQVYRATSKNGEYKLMKTTTGTAYTNTSAKAGKTYYYKVKAIHSNSSANSAYSSVDSIKAK